MNYNWKSASTPQGRDRLKDLMEHGEKVICRELPNNIGKNTEQVFVSEKDGSQYRIHAWIPASLFDDTDLDGIEFLDPEPQPQQPDENGLLPCPPLVWERSKSNKNRQNAHFMGCWYSIVFQKSGQWLCFFRDESGKGRACLNEETAKQRCFEYFAKLWESEFRRAGKEASHE